MSKGKRKQTRDLEIRQGREKEEEIKEREDKKKRKEIKIEMEGRVVFLSSKLGAIRMRSVDVRRVRRESQKDNKSLVFIPAVICQLEIQ